MLSKVRVKVGGKINLTLNILGKRGGYHLLDSVVASVMLCDYVTVRDRLDDKLNVVFNADFAVPSDNTVVKAVNALRKQFGPFGADVIVDKNLPLSGGMGGSSADAAGVICALNALFDFDKRGLDLKKVCASVGADVYYMCNGGYARMGGIGDDVEPLKPLCSLGFVYVFSGGTETASVYKAYDELGGDEMSDNEKLIKMLYGVEKSRDIRSLPLGNMLRRAACSLSAEIDKAYNALSEIGLNPNMTGSGSTVYAFCDDPERQAAILRQKGFDAHFAYTVPTGIQIL